MNQLAFNLSEAIILRDAGIKQVAENNSHFLEMARNVARSLAIAKYEITMDDVREACPLDPLHPAAWGAVFRHKDFICTYKRRNSKLVSNHAREIKVWRLRQ